MIKPSLFVILTIMIGVISQLVHPAIETWIPVSIATYVVIGILVFLATCSWKKQEKKKAINIGILAVILFSEYALISAIAYIRMIDDIIAEGPGAIVCVTSGSVIALIITFYEPVKRR